MKGLAGERRKIRKSRRHLRALTLYTQRVSETGLAMISEEILRAAVNTAAVRESS